MRLGFALAFVISGCVVEPARTVYVEPAPAAQPAPAVADADLQPVYRGFDGHDHMDMLVPGEGGFAMDNGGAPLFRTLRAPRPGAVEIRRCYRAEIHDHMFSIDFTHECPVNHYVIEGSLGYVYLHPFPGAIEVHRCTKGDDRMTTTNPDECIRNGYSVAGGFWAF
jgi:hypothetical protein